MTASLKPRTDAQIARVIDALEKVNQALRDAKQAMFYAQMSEYETIRGVAEQMFDLTASIAESGLRGSHLKSLAKSLEIRITEARALRRSRRNQHALRAGMAGSDGGNAAKAFGRDVRTNEPRSRHHPETGD